MINEHKITEWKNPIVNEADRPQRSASAMKEIFDSNSNQLRTALNALIDALIASGAEDIGASVDGMEGKTVDAVLEELKALIDSAGEDLEAVRTAVLPAGDGTLFLRNDGKWALPAVGAAANGVVAGGDKGYLYVKKSDKVYDAEWKPVSDLGFMTATTYDTNADGVVDTAENANKLGGKEPSEYQAAGSYASPAILRTATLGVADWTGAEAPFTQTVTVEGVLADETKQAIHVSPSAGYGTMYGTAGIECTSQGENSLTFTCETAPENDITVNIVIQEAQA